MSKTRYKVDLSAQMAECDMNYVRIRRLLPDLASFDSFSLGLTLPSGQPTVISFTVVERTRYTTTLIISKKAELPWLKNQDLSVRIYHDANTAEVMACWRGIQLNSRYTYPNYHMYQEDEKLQLNLFLGEWLTYCLEHGHSLSEIVLA